nr:putative phosphatidate phosphatase [Drosophila takahashii]
MSAAVDGMGSSTPFRSCPGNSNNNNSSSSCLWGLTHQQRYVNPSHVQVLEAGPGLCDLLIWAALSVASVLLHKLVRPFRRGFFCGDESLGYPHRDSTIGHELIIAIALGVPTAVIAVVELFKQLPESGGKKDGCRIGHRLGHLYRQAIFYLYGLAMVTFTTMLSKLCIGRLRPHFYAVCQPMLPDGSGCQDAQNLGRYIDSFTCSNANMSDFQFKQLNQSFPSGHASMAMYAMLYLVGLLVFWLRLLSAQK